MGIRTIIELAKSAFDACRADLHAHELSYRDTFGDHPPLLLEEGKSGGRRDPARLVLWRLGETVPNGVVLLGIDPHGCAAIVSRTRGVLLLDVSGEPCAKTPVGPRPRALTAIANRLLAEASGVPVRYKLARPFADGRGMALPFIVREEFTFQDPWLALAKDWPIAPVPLGNAAMTDAVRCLWGDLTATLLEPCWWEPGPALRPSQAEASIRNILVDAERRFGICIMAGDTQIAAYARYALLPAYERDLGRRSDHGASVWHSLIEELQERVLALAEAKIQRGIGILEVRIVPRAVDGPELLLANGGHSTGLRNEW